MTSFKCQAIASPSYPYPLRDRPRQLAMQAFSVATTCSLPGRTSYCAFQSFQVDAHTINQSFCLAFSASVNFARVTGFFSAVLLEPPVGKSRT